MGALRSDRSQQPRCCSPPAAPAGAAAPRPPATAGAAPCRQASGSTRDVSCQAAAAGIGRAKQQQRGWLMPSSSRGMDCGKRPTPGCCCWRYLQSQVPQCGAPNMQGQVACLGRQGNSQSPPELRLQASKDALDLLLLGRPGSSHATASRRQGGRGRHQSDAAAQRLQGGQRRHLQQVIEAGGQAQ